MTTFNAPHMDYAALSPLIALTAGLCVVLLGRRRPSRCAAATPALTLVDAGRDGRAR